jgi:endoglucanase
MRSRPGIVASRRRSSPPAVWNTLHLNGPEYGLNNPTGATQPFHQNNLGTYDSDYHFESQASLNYFAARGWKTVKVPVRWERLQSVISGPLNTAEMTRLTDFLDRCVTAGLKAVLDVHNYGVYYRDVSGTGTRTGIGTTNLPISAFADLWSRLASALNSRSEVVAYAIMAEPQSLGGLTAANWKTASQAAVDAIRAVDTTREIHVAGWDWSITQGWATVNGSPWITDPTGRFRYEGHHYWDSDTSGGYGNTYATEVTNADVNYDAGANPDALWSRIFAELDAFNTWCTTNGVKGIIGEMGWPGATDPAAWGALGDAYLQRARGYGLPCAVWAAGEWAFGGTSDLRVYTGSPQNTQNPQAATLEAYITPPG